MKFLFDVFPVVLFFFVFWWGDGHPETARAMANQYLGSFMSGGAVIGNHAPLLLATGAAIVVTIAQVAYELIRRKPVGFTLRMTLTVIVVFGGMTIYFNNDNFIKLKPTVLYWCFAMALIFSRVILKKNAIRSLMGDQFSLPERIWNKLDLAWILFFVCMGILNLFVAFVMFKDNNGAWVDFKLASIGISFVFIIVQSIYLSKHIEGPK
ncbi:MAG: septation protein A [Burkholderiaceae bacterium]|nr:septation protein A [Burkholderiaceae bacterium]